MEGWTILTSILFFREWNFQEAEAACRRVIELDPRNIKARQRYVDILRIRAEGRGTIRDRTGDPATPYGSSLRVTRALLLYEQGDYDQALAGGQDGGRSDKSHAGIPDGALDPGSLPGAEGRHSEAESTFRLALVHQPHAPWVEPSLGHLLARTNRTAQAEDLLAELRSHLDQGRMTYAAQTLIYAALGRTDEALQSLERGFSERDDEVLTVVHDPRLRQLRSIPAFKGLWRVCPADRPGPQRAEPRQIDRSCRQTRSRCPRSAAALSCCREGARSNP